MGDEALDSKTPSDDSQSSPAKRAETNAAFVWLELHRMFGDRFEREYGDLPTDTWKAGVAGYTRKELRGGLQRLMSSGREHPPPLPVFLAMVRNEHQKPPTVIPEPPPPMDKYEAWAISLLARYSFWRAQRGKPRASDADTRDLFREAKEFGAWFQAFADAGDANATDETLLQKFLERFVAVEDHDAVRAIEDRRRRLTDKELGLHTLNLRPHRWGGVTRG